MMTLRYDEIESKTAYTDDGISVVEKNRYRDKSRDEKTMVL